MEEDDLLGANARHEQDLRQKLQRGHDGEGNSHAYRGATTLIEGVMESETIGVEASDFGGMIQASKLLGGMVEVSMVARILIKETWPFEMFGAEVLQRLGGARAERAGSPRRMETKRESARPKPTTDRG